MMIFRSNIKVIIFTIFGVLLCSSAFAQSAAQENGRLEKEELNLNMNTPQGPGPGEKQKISIPNDAMTVKAPSAEKAKDEAVLKTDTKFSLNIKTKKFQKESIKTKKVFKPEVGIVEMAVLPSGPAGVLDVNDCIDIAVKNHLPLQIAEKSMALARMRVWEARRNMLPTFTWGYDAYSGMYNERAYIGKRGYGELNQPLFRGGELYYTSKQAEKNAEVAKNDYNRIKNELVLQVKKAYYGLAKAKENVKIQDELSQEVSRIYSVVTKQFEAGVSPRLEYLNVTSQASQVKSQFTAASGDVDIADLLLKNAICLDTKDKLKIKSDLKFKKVDAEYDKVLSAALVSRPEIKIKTLMIESQNFGLKAAKGKQWPKVDFKGMWGLLLEQYTDTLALEQDGLDQPDTMSPQWYAGIVTTVPIWGSTAEYSFSQESWQPVISTYHGTEAKTHSLKFKVLDKLDAFSERQSADIEFFKARQELIKARQDISLEARESCFNYEKALIQLQTQEARLKYQQTDLDILKMKRGMDEAQDSNVIESMIKLAQEKFGYFQALADCHTSLAAINKAVGVEDYFKDETE